MRTELEELREQHRNARSQKKMDEIAQRMQEISKKDPDAFALAMIELAKETADRAEELALRVRLKEVLPAVSISHIAKTYFGKTRSWLYQRINGSIVNGKPARLTDTERRTLEEAFRDIADKLTSIHVSPSV